MEPWNSVRIKFNITQEAAEKLKQLAENGDDALRNLGILSVQIDNDKIVKLTLASNEKNVTKKNDTLTRLLEKSSHSTSQPNILVNPTSKKTDVIINTDLPTTSQVKETVVSNYPVNINFSNRIQNKQEEEFKSPSFVKLNQNEENSSVNQIITSSINNRLLPNNINVCNNINSLPNKSISIGKPINQNVQTLSYMSLQTSPNQNKNNYPPTTSPVNDKSFFKINSANKSANVSPQHVLPTQNIVQQIQLKYPLVSSPSTNNLSNIISVKPPYVRNPNIKPHTINQNQIKTKELSNPVINKDQLSNSLTINQQLNNSSTNILNNNTSNVALTSPLLVNLLQSDVNDHFNSSNSNHVSLPLSINTEIKEPMPKKVKTKKLRKPKDKPPDSINNLVKQQGLAKNNSIKHINSSNDVSSINKPLLNSTNSPSNNIQFFDNKNLVSNTIASSSIIALPTTSISSTSNQNENTPSFCLATQHTSDSVKKFFSNTIEPEKNDLISCSTKIDLPDSSSVDQNKKLTSSDCLVAKLSDISQTSQINITTEQPNLALSKTPEIQNLTPSFTTSLSNSFLNRNLNFSQKNSDNSFLNSPSPVEQNKTKHLINPFTGQLEPMNSEDEEETETMDTNFNSNINVETNTSMSNFNITESNSKCLIESNISAAKEVNHSSDTDSGISKSTNDASSQSSTEISPIGLINNQDYLIKLDDLNFKSSNKLNDIPNDICQSNLSNLILIDNNSSLINFNNDSVLEDNSILKNKFVNDMLNNPQEEILNSSKEGLLVNKIKSSNSDLDVLNQSDYYLNNSVDKNNQKSAMSVENNQIDDYFNKPDNNLTFEPYSTGLDDLQSIVNDNEIPQKNFSSQFLNNKSPTACTKTENFKDSLNNLSSLSSLNSSSIRMPFTETSSNLLDNDMSKHFTNSALNNQPENISINDFLTTPELNEIKKINPNQMEVDEDASRNHSVAAGDHNYTNLKRPCAFTTATSSNNSNSSNNLCNNKIKKVNS